MTVAGTGQGTVSDGLGFTCSTGVCTNSYPVGTQVTLTATPLDSHSAFDAFSQDCAGTSCSVNMSADHAVTATFVPTFTLAVVPSALGYVNGDQVISVCTVGSGTCTATLPQGTVVNLYQGTSGNAFFVGWSGDCSGTTTCAVTLDQDRSVTPLFADFSVRVDGQNGTYSEVQGETRDMAYTVSVVPGSATIPISMTVTNLPGDVTATYLPQTGDAADGAPLTGVLQLAASSTAALSTYYLYITATSGTQTRTAYVTLEVRSPLTLVNPVGVAVEDGGATALVVESENASRLTRISVADKSVLNTVASLPAISYPARGVAIEPGGATALVTYENAVARVDLATGAHTDLTTGLHEPLSIALESGGGTALVTDCGVNSDCNNGGRVVRVNLSDGGLTQVSAALTAFNYPAGIAIEPDGLHADIVETNVGRVSRLRLSSGSVATLNASMPSYVTSIALDADGNHVLVGEYDGSLVRVQVHTGIQSWVAKPGGAIGGVALIPGTSNAVATLHSTPGAVRVLPVPNLLEIIAPSTLTSAAPLDQPTGLVIEPGGATALVSDTCGSGFCGQGVTGALERVDLATGNVTVLNTTLNYPQGIQLDPSASSVLVANHSSDDVTRVDLGTGVMSVASAQDQYAGPDSLLVDGGVAIESSGGFNSPSLRMVDVRADGGGGWTTLAGPWACCKEPWQMEFTADAQGFFFAFRNGGAAGDPNGSPTLYNSIGELNLYSFADGGISTVVEGLDVPSGIALESGGTVAIAEYGGYYAYGRMVRANPATGQYSVLFGGLFQLLNSGGEFFPRFMQLESSGNSALVTYGHYIARANLTPTVGYARVAGPFESPQGFQLESSGTTGIMTTCGETYSTLDCTQNGTLVRVNVADGGATTLATGLNTPHALALDSASTALVTDCGVLGAPNGCNGSARILRVDLGNGSKTIVSTGLNDPRCITPEPGGTVLLCENGTGRILRMDPSDGSYVAIASNVYNPAQITLEPNGTTALVGVSNNVVRMDLTTGAITQIGNLAYGSGMLPSGSMHFSLSADGTSALVVPENNAWGGELLRLDTRTGGLDVLHPSLFDLGSTIVPYGNGSWLVVEERPRTGGLFLLTP